jgi:hypothetical protein
VRTILFASWLAAAVVVQYAAAQAGIQGPVSGFVLDSRMAAIRPVNGMPGASTLGPALALPFPIQSAAIAAAMDFALAVSGSDGALYLVRGLASGSPTAAGIEGAMDGASRLLLNAPGTAALLFSADSQLLQLITGLPAQARVSATLDTSTVGALSAMALSADATRIVAGTAGEGALYEFNPGGDGPRWLAATHGLSAVAFRNGDRDILFANQATNEVVLLSGSEGDGGIAVLAGEPDGVSQPVALASLNGGREVWVANSGASSVLAIDMANPGSMRVMALAGVPTRCEALDGNSLIVLNEPAGVPLLLADSAAHAVYFVPADAAGAQ